MMHIPNNWAEFSRYGTSVPDFTWVLNPIGMYALNKGVKGENIRRPFVKLGRLPPVAIKGNGCLSVKHNNSYCHYFSPLGSCMLIVLESLSNLSSCQEKK